MALKFKLLILTLLLSLTAFSQSVTSKISVIDTCRICLPCTTAKKIAIDLAKGDSTAAELTATQTLLMMTEQKVELKDSIIGTYVIKEANYNEQINLYKQKEEKYLYIVTGLENDNKKLKKTVKVLGGSVIALALTTLVGFLVH